MHKSTDYSKTGGFPGDVDAWEFDRTGMYEALTAVIKDAGSTPIVLAGVVGGNGWVYFNNEILPFVQPSPLPPLTSGWAYYVTIVETRTAAEFQDGMSYDVWDVTRYATYGSYPTITPPAGGVLLDSFVPWSKIFGEKARGAEQTIEGTTTHYDYSWRYKKNTLTNTLHLRGTITIRPTVNATPQAYSLGNLPVGFRPANMVPLVAMYWNHLSNLKDSTSADFIDVANGQISTGGTIGFVLRRPDTSVTSYTLYVNTIIPLD